MAIAVFVNPASGRGAGRGLYEKLVERRRRDPAFSALVSSILFTRDSGTVQAIRDCDTVLVCGGDGTIHGVVNAMLSGGLEKRISLYPLGTGNDFSRCFPNGERDIFSHIKAIAEKPEVRMLDVFRLNDRAYFVNYAGFGLDAFILRRFESWLVSFPRLAKIPFFKLGLYLPAGVSALLSYDGKVSYGGKDYGCVVTANLRSYAGGGSISAVSDPGDGKPEVVKMKGGGDLFRVVMSRFVQGVRPPADTVSPAEIKVEAHGDITVQLDGEDYTDVFKGERKFEIALAKKLEVCV